MAPTPGAAPPAPPADNDVAPASLAVANVPPAQGTSGVRNFGNQRRMISELERINALNLEPSLPKIDDGNRNVSRYSQDRTKVKNEFQTFLSEMKKNDEAKAGNQPHNLAASSTRKDTSGQVPSGAQKTTGPGTTSSQPNLSLQPAFMVENATGKVLNNILEDMLLQASSVPTASLEPDWPEAQGPSYQEVLGRPTGKPCPTLPNGDIVGGNHAPNDAGARPGHAPQGGNNARPPMGQDQMRPMGPPQGGMPQGMHHQQQQQGGYVMQGGPQQGGQPQMQMFMPGMGQGPQGMQPMQGMNMQGQQMFVGQGPNGQQMGGMMMGQQPMGMMMAAPQQGGQNAQQGGGPMNQGGMPYNDGQQQQQMMFMPVMMSQDANGQYMQQGMPGYQQGQQGNTGNPQQGAFMMQQPMFHQQGNS